MINGIWSSQPEGAQFPELGDRFEEWWDAGLQWYRDLRQLQGGPNPKPVPEVFPEDPPPQPAKIGNLGALLFVVLGIIAIVWIRR